MTAESTRLLQEMPLFGGMSANTLEFLVSLATRVEQPPGTCFFREGDAAESMFVLERGCAAVSKQWKGSEFVLRELKRGDCFGEMALIDYAPRSATVRAVEPCIALEIAADSLLRLYETELEQFAIMQMNIAREISRRLRSLEQRVFEHDVENGNTANKESVLDFPPRPLDLRD